MLLLTMMRSDDYDPGFPNNPETFVCNVKAVSFIPLFVKLAIEFNAFDENKRGGLLIEDGIGNNTLHHYLAFPPDASLDEHRQQHVDTTFLAVLIQLRQSGWFVQNDIQQYQLVHQICRKKYFSEQRFRFMHDGMVSFLIITSIQYQWVFTTPLDDGFKTQI